MNRIQDYISDIVSKFNISNKDAERFITLIFEVLDSGLHEDKQVKINGLGTFKITSVSARESINVNTGERILIEGRDKISFTPDALMRDRVNSPFSQFETVVINEGIDFSEIDEKYNTDSSSIIDDNDDNETKEPSENAEIIQQEEPTNAKKIINNEEINKPKTEEGQEEDEVEDLNNNEYVDEFSDENNIITEKNYNNAIESISNNTSDTSNTSCDINEETLSEEQAQDGTYSDADMDILKERLHHNGNTIKVLITLIFVLIIAFGGGFYYIWQQIELRDNRIEHLESFSKTMPQVKGTKKVSQKMKEKPVVQKIKKDNKSTNIPPKVPAIKRMKEVQETVKEETKQYDKDPRVRTGAYCIVGISQKVTVHKGQTLSSISKTYLGPGMECYMEAVNNNGNIKEGQKINIPALELRKKRR